MSRARVQARVGTLVKSTDATIGDVHTMCGGAASIAQAEPDRAAQCKASLSKLAGDARALVSLLANIRPPDEFQSIFGEIEDAARTVTVAAHLYPAARCLPSPAAGLTGGGVCDGPGRDLVAAIAQLRRLLQAWPAN